MTDLVGVILAAGAGTRLRPLTEHRPKPLCPVDNVPLVDHALDAVRRVTARVAVNVHHGRAQMEDHLSGRVHLSVEEPHALGTAGALGALKDWIDGSPVLVANADSWHREDLAALVDGWDGERMRLIVVDDPTRADFGTTRYVGISLLPWAAVRTLPAEPSGLYELLWRDAWTEGRLDLLRSDGVFIDCGTIHDYHRANMTASGGRNVVGAGARVDGTLIRSVVWPGGVVEADETLVDSIRVGRDLTLRA